MIARLLIKTMCKKVDHIASYMFINLFCKISKCYKFISIIFIHKTKRLLNPYAKPTDKAVAMILIASPKIFQVFMFGVKPLRAHPKVRIILPHKNQVKIRLIVS